VWTQLFGVPDIGAVNCGAHNVWSTRAEKWFASTTAKLVRSTTTHSAFLKRMTIPFADRGKKCGQLADNCKVFA